MATASLILAATASLTISEGVLAAKFVRLPDRRLLRQRPPALPDVVSVFHLNNIKYLVLDTILVRVHQQAGGGKGG